MIDFMHKAAKVTDDIMTCFAIGLGLPEDFYREVSQGLKCSTITASAHAARAVQYRTSCYAEKAFS